MSEKVLITGATSGIGEATAYVYAARGAHLFLVARRTDGLQRVAGTCREKGAAQAQTYSQDLSQAGAGHDVVEQCLHRLGGLDILILNAGYGTFGPVEEISPDEMRRIWQVNFQSAYESIHRAVPYFKSRRQGKIVLVSSIVGKKAIPFAAPYCATKFAQAGLGESLWGELKDHGIQVTVLCPGYTDTAFHSASARFGAVRGVNRPFAGQSPERVASSLERAVRKGRREIHLTAPGKALLLIDRLSNNLATRIMAYLNLREKQAKH